MKRVFLLVLLVCGFSMFLAAQGGIYQHGTVVRMHMGNCTIGRHGFMASFGAPAMPAVQESCPEYTLVSDKVVFVIVGKASNQLIPLAEIIDYRFRNNELAVRVDDANREAKFAIKEMILRPEWERVQQHVQEKIRASYNPEANPSFAVRASE
jgi:hypothetical protein